MRPLAIYIYIYYINDIKCPCLNNTGAQVTTTTDTFHKENLSHLPIEPLTNILTTEGAGGGHQMKYSGCVMMDVSFPDELDETRACYPTPVQIMFQSKASLVH